MFCISWDEAARFESWCDAGCSLQLASHAQVREASSLQAFYSLLEASACVNAEICEPILKCVCFCRGFFPPHLKCHAAWKVFFLIARPCGKLAG